MNAATKLSSKAGRLMFSRSSTFSCEATQTYTYQATRQLSCAYLQYRSRHRIANQNKYIQQRDFSSLGAHRDTFKKRTPVHLRDAKLATKDRGPQSSESTVTNFGDMNVLGRTPNPSTSVDICAFDGFELDSGLRIGDGDGVVLLGSEAFVWRPWTAAAELVKDASKAVSGNALRKTAPKGANESLRTGGIINTKGQWEIPDLALGIFNAVVPRPDLLIVGTGPSIRPLAPSTRDYLQQLGMRIEVLDTRNAASQFNLLAAERGVDNVAAALVPIGFGVE